MSDKTATIFPKERLLNQAETLFAQKGYHAVTVREITEAARCNLAAVNYHFGSKRNLYLEVFRSRWIPRAKLVFDSFEAALDGLEGPSVTETIRALAKAFVDGPMSEEHRRHHYQLMARELSHPSEAFDLVAEEVMRPSFLKLGERLQAALPPGREKEDLTLSMMSIFAIILHFNFARVAVTRLTGQAYEPSFKSLLVEHITKFSVNALTATQGNTSQ